MPLKTFLTSALDALQWILHVVLIPVIAVLKAIDTGIQHLITELGKV